ncbi:hypothetical protein [Lysobacter gummosus]
MPPLEKGRAPGVDRGRGWLQRGGFAFAGTSRAKANPPNPFSKGGR